MSKKEASPYDVIPNYTKAKSEFTNDRKRFVAREIANTLRENAKNYIDTSIVYVMHAPTDLVAKMNTKGYDVAIDDVPIETVPPHVSRGRKDTTCKRLTITHSE